MKKSEEWAKENGYEEIRLRSGGQRKEAHQFYKTNRLRKYQLAAIIHF